MRSIKEEGVRLHKEQNKRQDFPKTDFRSAKKGEGHHRVGYAYYTHGMSYARRGCSSLEMKRMHEYLRTRG